MCIYSHLVLHENYETEAVFGALMMPTRGTLTILAIWKQSIQTTLDKMIKNCRGRYQVWYEDRDKAITFCCVTPGMTDYTTVFEIDEEVVTTVKTMAKCEINTKLHWSIFNDYDAIFPIQIAYRAMTNFSYANGRAKNGCPICVRLVTDDYKTYRDVREMPNDDLKNMIRFVSEPYWPWRSEVIDDNANLNVSQTIKKTDDSNKDKDEQEPMVSLLLIATPDRREGVLNDSADSVIASIYSWISCLCVIAPVIMVLSVVVKCGTLSLQSDRLLWSDRTHSRMMRGSSLQVHSLHSLLEQFGQMFPNWACWKRYKKSDINRSTISRFSRESLQFWRFIFYTTAFLKSSRRSGQPRSQFKPWYCEHTRTKHVSNRQILGLDLILCNRFSTTILLGCWTQIS